MKVLSYEVVLTGKNANGEYAKACRTGMTVDGKEIQKPAENLPKDLLNWFRTQPRVSVRSNGSPKIKFGETEAQLGYWATNEEEKERYNNSRKGGSSGTHTSGSKIPEGVKEELESLIKESKGQTKTQLQAIYDKLFPDPRALEIAKLEARLAALRAEM